MAEIDYWFVKNMYILGVVGITVAVVQVMSDDYFSFSKIP